ncbi:MAG TPA: hypothetical protein VF950_24155 [Planctomycetota bacterium]
MGKLGVLIALAVLAVVLALAFVPLFDCVHGSGHRWCVLLTELCHDYDPTRPSKACPRCLDTGRCTLARTWLAPPPCP